MHPVSKSLNAKSLPPLVSMSICKKEVIRVVKLIRFSHTIQRKIKIRFYFIIGIEFKLNK